MTGANHSSSSKTHSHQMVQNILNSNELEFYELACSSGLTMNPQVFKILVDLIRLDVSPSAIFTMLENMSTLSTLSNQSKSSGTSRTSSSQTHKQKREIGKTKKGSTSQDV
ncbi:mitotic-spindle organizing protein 2-like [Centruroides sculpturatus]|uniref:mitotic-spindle organizing protein 2-like n=1 Tax=Centruroides sculpturatus TaxID=218467 RepID=UPI000C6E09FE|nr:mitotic-spindle organizing protein 2-like [Centruroides sculpturatus]XP_023228322.1 mitotic-spindle organizing protein 2-like [Centruroides sculpturatus]